MVLRSTGAWHQGAWQNVHGNDFVTRSDAKHAMLVRRLDACETCIENSPEEAELEAIADALKAHEAKRGPVGNMPGRKG
jgi:hypothetical protein